jgi:hypothetical protein
MSYRLARGFLVLLGLGLFALGGWQFCRQEREETPRLLLEGGVARFDGLASYREAEVFIRMCNPGRRDLRIIGSSFC